MEIIGQDQVMVQEKDKLRQRKEVWRRTINYVLGSVVDG